MTRLTRLTTAMLASLAAAAALTMAVSGAVDDDVEASTDHGASWVT